MPDRIETKFGPVDIPSVDDFRAIGRERLMTYFVCSGVTPPDDVDAMAQSAHELLVHEAVNDPFDWMTALKTEQWIPMEEVMRDLGIDTDVGPADESAA
jgi:hypothetical protein